MPHSGMSHMRKQVQQLFYVVSNFILRMYYEPCLLKEAQNQNDMTSGMVGERLRVITGKLPRKIVVDSVNKNSKV